MRRGTAGRLVALLATTATLGLAVGVASSEADPSTHYSGTLADQATWIADVPADWNGTLVLFSHGFGPLNAADAPDPATGAALLDAGYALAGSSYDPTGSWWALGNAVRDQFQTLEAVKRTVLPHQPRRVIALGESMGGLVSALEAERSYGRIDAALTTCGLVAGAIALNNYQLDGEYAINELLAPNQEIKIARFASMEEGAASADAQTNVARQAQTTPQGRARLALAMAFLNVPTWAPEQVKPGARDFEAQERQQFDTYFGASSVLSFIQPARYMVEQAAGGNGSWTAGVDFARVFERSSYRREVQALYRRAGLSLRADLARLTRKADIHADRQALRWLRKTSVPAGRLQVPELNIHTISDQLVPVQQERDYAREVRSAGQRRLLRQAFVDRQLHCNFTPAEELASVLAVEHRLDAGRWGAAARPDRLQATAAALDLGGAAFIRYRPAALTGNNGRFLPWGWR